MGARAAGAPVGETGAMTGLERHMGVLELAAQSIAAIDSANVAFGSRLCKNADTETNCATIESMRCRGRIIVAAKANFLIQCFVSVYRKLFLHSLGHNRKSVMAARMSLAGV